MLYECDVEMRLDEMRKDQKRKEKKKKGAGTGRREDGELTE
jgi:hypothetical protein